MYSLHGIITPEAVVYLPALEGTWQHRDGYTIAFFGTRDEGLKVIEEIDSVTFRTANGDILHYPEDYLPILAATFWHEIGEPSEEQSPPLSRQDSLENGAFNYFIEINKESEQFHFLGQVAQIGGEYYLDLTHLNLEFDEPDSPYKVQMPVHSFLKIAFKEDGQLQLIDFDLSKMRDLFRANQIRLKHEDMGDEILITAQPEEIQAFLKTYGESPDVFDGSKDFTKVTP
ncbi:MAG TPA: hypothetical protein DCR93_36000 [Cytophagales bacterium]|nr:hypothetical protein [Cytophagales bacterium]HAP64661.1 hypothetical protein [Cytophagales bacterium]